MTTKKLETRGFTLDDEITLIGILNLVTAGCAGWGIGRLIIFKEMIWAPVILIWLAWMASFIYEINNVIAEGNYYRRRIEELRLLVDHDSPDTRFN